MNKMTIVQFNPTTSLFKHFLFPSPINIQNTLSLFFPLQKRQHSQMLKTPHSQQKTIHSLLILTLYTGPVPLYIISRQVAILIKWGSSRKQQKIPNMLRVLLRIDTVRLKVREDVDLHIVIRKDHHHFTHARGEPLRDGQATLTQSSEFLLDGTNPRFDLEVFLIAGETRKRGGVASINLRAFALNASHRVVLPLRKTPLTDSSLSVDFVYMFAQGSSASGGVEPPLVSLQLTQQQEHRQHLKQITAEHQKLIFHNSRLNQQIKRLKKQNQDLSNQRHSLEQTITKKEEQYSSEMQKMEQQREVSLSQLQSQRKKVEMIVEKIASSGDLELKLEMDRMINQGQKSDPPTTTAGTETEP